MGGGVGRSNGNSVISGASALPTPIIELMPCEIATEPLNKVMCGCASIQGTWVDSLFRKPSASRNVMRSP